MHNSFEWVKSHPRFDKSLVFNADDALIQTAPLLKVTDIYMRNFLRLFSKHTTLWTPMIVDETILNTPDVDKFVGYHPSEHPIVFQLGGNDTDNLAKCASMIENLGYDEININAGCPSNRVVNRGNFGITLLKNHQVLYDIITRIQDTVKIPISIKTRIGIDYTEGGEWLDEKLNFIYEHIADKKVILHARRAILDKNFSAKNNRSIPALNYTAVFDFIDKNPNFKVILNGGVRDIELAYALLKISKLNDPKHSALHGIMIGRAVIKNPCMLANVDKKFYHSDSNPESSFSRFNVLNSYKYILEKLSPHEKAYKNAHIKIRPIISLFYNTTANKIYKKFVTSTLDEKSGLISVCEIIDLVIAYLAENFNYLLHEPIVQ